MEFLIIFAVLLVARGAWAILVWVRYRRDVAAFQWRDDITPLQFEQRCAEAMRIAGWHATHTGCTGDQGCDVLANRGGIRVALQCKKLKHSVGNGAVQQALAAKAMTRATHAAVVSNAGYTKGARELAKVTGVLLLNWRDLQRANALFGRRRWLP